MLKQLLTTITALTVGFSAMAQQSDGTPTRKALPSFPKKQPDTTQIQNTKKTLEKLPPVIASDLHFTGFKGDDKHFLAAIEDTSVAVFLDVVPAIGRDGGGLHPDYRRKIQIKRNVADTSIDDQGNEVVKYYDQLIAIDERQDIIINVQPGVLQAKKTSGAEESYAFVSFRSMQDVRDNLKGIGDPVEAGDKIVIPTRINTEIEAKMKENLAPQKKKELPKNASFSERVRNNGFNNN